MEGSKYLLIFSVAAILAFSYQGAEASFSADHIITNTAGGGDCEGNNIGTWNSDTLTCTLTGLLLTDQNIVIDGDDITLDGNGWGLVGSGCFEIGILVPEHDNVTIKNIDNPRVEKEEHYYNPAHTGLLDLGLSPHLLTEERLTKIFQTVEKYKNKIQRHKIIRGVKW